ncbi:NADP-dependent oxidoreductase [Salsipaludibacter albus]|uniref:NADP-dependent oxidoreductase n=1 Tax=Salsipaludibacter albus TaxID=2849650 RepID=UPI001EE4A49C|nr:NADP-dependent oxidoreductase [Salsipaludibacter albus]MBY5163876.1 NADP-dependent oxidoreductase [Salsipaludibacter albus]
MADQNRQWRLKTTPHGPIDDDTFTSTSEDVPEPGDGEALVAVQWLSMDPTIRGWLERDTYVPKIQEGEVVRGLGIGEVVASKSDRYAVGDLVSGTTGWQEFAIADEGDRRMQVVPAGTDPLDAVGLLGPTGLAAYFGLLRVGQPEEGDTVLVSGAAGATGSVAGQIAKLKGCTVIGTAGSDDKCARVVDHYGFDACINYKTERVSSRLRELAPDGIDVFFDNVGGDVLEAGLANLALHARIAVCGAISQYDGGTPRGPRNYMNLVVKRARMEGFLIFDHVRDYRLAMGDLTTWASEGRIRHEVDVVEGFDNVPAAFQRLFTGDKVGKNAVHLT